MSGLRQSIQQELAREPIERGEAPIAGSERTLSARGNAFGVTRELRAWMG